MMMMMMMINETNRPSSYWHYFYHRPLMGSVAQLAWSRSGWPIVFALWPELVSSVTAYSITSLFTYDQLSGLPTPWLTNWQAGRRPLQCRIKVCGGPGQDHHWRPLPTLKCYNLHALTIVIITKYIYTFLWRSLSCGGPWATAQFAPHPLIHWQ